MSNSNVLFIPLLTLKQGKIIDSLIKQEIILFVSIVRLDLNLLTLLFVSQVLTFRCIFLGSHEYFGNGKFRSIAGSNGSILHDSFVGINGSRFCNGTRNIFIVLTQIPFQIHQEHESSYRYSFRNRIKVI